MYAPIGKPRAPCLACICAPLTGDVMLVRYSVALRFPWSRTSMYAPIGKPRVPCLACICAA
ncbi:MAG: hypothetical protein IKA57_05540 [Clostridia bacterium]|nr:hypothetical protein [Clostridia bacterium]